MFFDSLADELALLQQDLPPFAVDVVRTCVWFILLLLIFAPLEKIFSRHRQSIFRKSFVTDLGYYFINSLIPRLLLILPLSLLARATHRVIPVAWYSEVANLPFWVRFAAAAIVGDIGSYWGHRSMHEIPLLWRFHAVHHSAEEMDWLVNTRAHPVDIVITRLSGLIPLYVLGLAQPLGSSLDPVPLLLATFGTVWAFLIHANLNWRLGWVEWLISTPGFHHWHHANDGPANLDKNYAALLPLVDRCFGTLYLPPKQWPAAYGTDTPIAAHLAVQLVEPFGPGPARETPGA